MSFTNNDIYVDILTTNLNKTSSNQKVQCQFNQQPSQSILKSTNGYKLSVIRFAISTENLPVFIPQMKDVSTNTTVYSITMEYGSSSYQQYMQFIPQNLNVTDPDEMYYINSYQYLVYLVNNCFQQCLTNLKTLTTDILLFSVPIMSFDTTNQICSISINDSQFGYNETNKVNIYMNYEMYALFSSLPSINVNKNVSGMDYQLNNLISNDKSLLTQEFSTVSLWNPISSVIFTSTQLPIYSSQTPPLQIYTQGLLSNVNSTFNFMNIITDFIGNNLLFVPFLQYAPTVYRYVSLKPNSEVRSIDIKVFWMNRLTGEMKPLYMSPGSTASLKLLFTTNN